MPSIVISYLIKIIHVNAQYCERLKKSDVKTP